MIEGHSDQESGRRAVSAILCRGAHFWPIFVKKGAGFFSWGVPRETGFSGFSLAAGSGGGGQNRNLRDFLHFPEFGQNRRFLGIFPKKGVISRKWW